MRHPKIPTRKPQEVRLSDDPSGTWTYGGCEFAGGTLEIGSNVASTKSWRYARWAQPDANIALGVLMLAAMGRPDTKIGHRVGLNHSMVSNVVVDLRANFEVPTREMLLRLALEQRIFRLVGYGSPEDNFWSSARERTQLGLLARGVTRQVIAEALSMEKAGDVDVEINSMGKREGVGRGCIAAAILNHQIGATTCVPLYRSQQAPDGIKPLLPLEEWDALITDPDVGSLRSLFSTVEKIQL